MGFEILCFNKVFRQFFLFMKFNVKFFHKILIYFYITPLYLAVDKENVDIVKQLIKHKKIDVNIKSVLMIYCIYIISYFISFNFIHISMFQ